MIYRLNGRVYSTLGATTVKYMTEAERQRENAKLKLAANKAKATGQGTKLTSSGFVVDSPFAGEARLKEWEKIKNFTFAQLDSYWQGQDDWYRNTYCATVPFGVREKMWKDRGGRASFLRQYLLTTQAYKYQKRAGQTYKAELMPTPMDVFKNWVKTQKIIENAQATVAAAAQAVQTVQAANPQVTQQEAVAAASRVTSEVLVSNVGGGSQGSGGASSASAPAPQTVVPVAAATPAATAASPVAGVAGAGLAAAGLYLLFGL